MFHSLYIDGSGCQKCNLSKGEFKISTFLTENKIKFIPQFKFDECRNINPLPFDFFLPEMNICIEYDGELHFLDLGFNNLKITQENDQTKTNFCLKNGIELIRIRYTEKDEIDNILLKRLIK